MGCTISAIPRRSSSSLNQLRSLEHSNDPENLAIPKEVNDIEHLNTTSPQVTSINDLKSNIQIQPARRESTVTTSTVLSSQPPRRGSTVTTSTILSSHISPSQKQHMSTLIQELLQSLQTYESLITTTNFQSLCDINASLNSLPNHIPIFNSSTDSSPRTVPGHEVSVNVRTKLQYLYTLQTEKSSLITTYFKPLDLNLEKSWTSLCELKPEEQREMAWGESRHFLPIQMFHLLKNVRTGCVEVRKIEEKIARFIGGEFEVVLELLKTIETGIRMEGTGFGGGGGGGKRGLATGAAMQWRVFELLERKRMDELKGVEEVVLECRMRVSKELLDVVEGLKEEF